MKIVHDLLFQMRDENYREFNAKLIPCIEKDRIIGIRIPVLRKMAKDMYKEKWVGEFLHHLPHRYFEENNLHAFLIEQENDIRKSIELTEEFLPFIDNWATCDSFFPKIFKKNTEMIDEKINLWLASDKEYTVRYALGLIMRLHLDDNFDCSYLKKASEIISDKYYINMMIAWLFATALAKYENETMDFIINKKLPLWVHNKTIQKSIESNRINPQLKEILKKYKIPNNA